MRNEVKLAKIVKLPLNEYSDSHASNKEVFLGLGRRVLAALVKEFGLVDYKLNINRAGAAVSGDATMIGMWDGDNGIYINMSSPGMYKEHGKEVFYYRDVRAIDDYTGGINQTMSYELIASEGIQGAAAAMMWQLGR